MAITNASANGIVFYRRDAEYAEDAEGRPNSITLGVLCVLGGFH